MKKLVNILSLTFCTSLQILAQKDSRNIMVDSLKYLGSQPFSCNSIYWKVISAGKEMIPILIAKMDDTSHTSISLTCKRNNVKLGDICYHALTEIFNIPLFYVTKMQFDWYEVNGCRGGVFDYLESSRAKFKQQVLDYYTKYKSDIKFVSYYKGYERTECEYKNKLVGYFEVDTKLLK